MTDKTQREVEISLYDIFQFYVANIRVVLIVTAISAVLGVFIALLVPNKYTSDLLLLPSLEDGSGLKQAAGSLASLVGAASGVSSAGEEVKIAGAYLESRQFLDEFVKRHNLKKELFADRWDDVTGEWKLGFFNPLSFLRGLLRGNDGGSEDTGLMPNEPGVWQVYWHFQENLVLREDNLTGTFVLSYTHKSPSFSAKLLQLLIADINELVRKEEIRKSEVKIQYFRDQLSQNNIAEMKTVITLLIGESMQRIALAKARVNYVFVVIDTAIPPIERSSPNRIMILIIFILAGGLFAAVVARFVNKRQRKKQEGAVL